MRRGIGGKPQLKSAPLAIKTTRIKKGGEPFMPSRFVLHDEQNREVDSSFGEDVGLDVAFLACECFRRIGIMLGEEPETLARLEKSLPNPDNNATTHRRTPPAVHTNAPPKST